MNIRFQKLSFMSKITFKQWASNFFKGIWQAMCWVGRAFNPKNKTPFWRIIWATITVCIVIVTGILCYQCYSYTNEHENRWVHIQRISQNLDFVRSESKAKPGWISNHVTGEVMTKDIDWVAVSADEDSLMVFGRGDKRGYINRYSGEISIPAKYKKAYVFSSGVAGVAEGDSIFFIDHSGKPINDKKFKINPKNSNYVYHGEYCSMNEPSGKMGLIDKAGNWVVAPEYDWFMSEANNYWRARKGNNETGLWYAFNDKAHLVGDGAGYTNIDVSPDLGVVCTMPDHTVIAYSFNGDISDDFYIKEVETLYYDTELRDEEGNFIPAPSTLMRYRMADGYEGLCDKNGKPVTPPSFWYVNSVSKDLYLCTYKDTSAGVFVNSNGEIVKKQANS